MGSRAMVNFSVLSFPASVPSGPPAVKSIKDVVFKSDPKPPQTDLLRERQQGAQSWGWGWGWGAGEAGQCYACELAIRLVPNGQDVFLQAPVSYAGPVTGDRGGSRGIKPYTEEKDLHFIE